MKDRQDPIYAKFNIHEYTRKVSKVEKVNKSILASIVSNN